MTQDQERRLRALMQYSKHMAKYFKNYETSYIVERVFELCASFERDLAPKPEPRRPILELD